MWKSYNGRSIPSHMKIPSDASNKIDAAELYWEDFV